MLNKDLEVSLNVAFRKAKESRHEFMTVEHLLLALLDNPSSNDALSACGADMHKLRTDLEQFIGETTPVIPEGDEERETQPTLDSNAYCNVRSFTYSHQVKVKLPAPMYWSLFLVNRSRKQLIS